MAGESRWVRCLVSSRLHPACSIITRHDSYSFGSCFIFNPGHSAQPNLGSTMSSQRPVLPASYFYFFFLVEPVCQPVVVYTYNLCTLTDRS